MHALVYSRNCYVQSILTCKKIKLLTTYSKSHYGVGQVKIRGSPVE